MASKQATMLSIISRLYSKPNHAHDIDIDIKKQIEYLNPDKRQLCQIFISDKISDKSLRNAFDLMLSDYYHHWDVLQNENCKMFKDWDVGDLSLDLIVYFIQHCNDNMPANETDKKTLKRINTAWRFLDFMLLYLQQHSFDGKAFIAAEEFEAQKTKPTRFALRIVKEVCKQFGEKSGPYAKVKKALSIWAEQRMQRYENELKFPLSDLKIVITGFCRDAMIPKEVLNIILLFYPRLPEIDTTNISNPHKQKHLAPNSIPKAPRMRSYDKPVRDVRMIANEQHNDTLKGKRWYWFNDVGGLQWRPYKDIDCQKLNVAWINNEKSCLVVDGAYRVEFNRSNASEPCGNQYKNCKNIPFSRAVVCCLPMKKIHGVDVCADIEPLQQSMSDSPLLNEIKNLVAKQKVLKQENAELKNENKRLKSRILELEKMSNKGK